MSKKFDTMFEMLNTEYTQPVEPAPPTGTLMEPVHPLETIAKQAVQEVGEKVEEIDNCAIWFEASDENTELKLCCNYADENTEECDIVISMCEKDKEDCLCLCLTCEQLQTLCDTLQNILQQQKTEEDIVGDDVETSSPQTSGNIQPQQA